MPRPPDPTLAQHYLLTTIGGGRHRGRALLPPRLLHHAAAPGGRAVARGARGARARSRSSRGGAVGALAMSKPKPIWPASAAIKADWPRLAYGWGSLRHDLALTVKPLWRASWLKSEPHCFDIVFHLGAWSYAPERG
eukprot:scaffold51973_cov69-Phaeocystis_antarctica.AAC.2